MAAQHRQAQGMAWGIPFLMGCIVGGVVGWLASTLMHAGRSRGRRNRHPAHRASPIAIQKYLRGVDYPVQKHNLLATARAEGADEAVLHTLAQLPERWYLSPIEVSRAIGQMA
jgi:hypothetical protein